MPASRVMSTNRAGGISAFGLAGAAGALSCQAPAKDGLFDAPLGGAAPTAGAGQMATALPAEGEDAMGAAGAGGSGASADESPPLLGFGGFPGESPPGTSVTGAAGLLDAGAAPTAADAGIAPVDYCVLGAFQAPELLTGMEQSLNPELDLNLWSPSLSKSKYRQTAPTLIVNTSA